MVPEDEIDTLLTLVDDAISMAGEGQLANGYSLLLAGLHYAEQQHDEAAPCADELVEHYRLAVENYGSNYGERMR